MSRVFVTGSTDGLGLAAARALLAEGHTVVGHARGHSRAEELRARLPGLADVLIGDLSRADETRALALQANEWGKFDAVIHNAGVGYREPRRINTVDGHSHVLAINTLAPYILTAMMDKPDRLIYLSSGMHRSADDTLFDIDWIQRPWLGAQAYSDSKLFDAVLAVAVARLWPTVCSNALEPGWVPTKMGGPAAPDDMSLAHVTQVWLAVSDDRAATVTGEYFYHQRPREPHPIVRSTRFQDALLEQLASLTDVQLNP